MDTKIIDGKKIAANVRAKLQQEIKTFERRPKLAVILVGNDPASQIYVKHKIKVAAEVGVDVEVHELSPVMTTDALVEFVRGLNKAKDVDGILVQMPLPKPLKAEVVLQEVDPEKDVDGLHFVNLGKLFIGQPNLVPCTPQACMALIESVCPKLEGLTAVVVGRSNLVGRPLAQLLLNANCTVIQAHSKTTNLADITKKADILVSATGHAHLITVDYVKKGAVVIDVGISRGADGKIVGDVDFENVQKIAGFITPVPGGVGPMTIVMIFQNIVQIMRKKLVHTSKG